MAWQISLRVRIAHAKAQKYQPCFFFFLICQVICYSVIEESAHVIGKSQSTREEGARTDEEGERWRWRWWRGRGEKEVVRIN